MSRKNRSTRNSQPTTNNSSLAPRPSSLAPLSAFRIPYSAFYLGLLVLALAAYLPALGAGFLWDDDAMTASPLVASWGGLLKMWVPPSLAPRETHFWPLVYSTFWLEYRLWGPHPFGYHLVNVLLHGLCAVLLWRVLKKLEAPGAWLAGALFAVHPVHAESVAWVIERKDVLSGALALGAALAFLGARTPSSASLNPQSAIRNPQSPIPPSALFYALSLVLFAGALLSKSIVVGLPLGLAAALWWRRGRLGPRDAAALAGMLALAAAITLADLKFMNAHLLEPVVSGLTWPQRVLVASRALWVYLLKLAWPHPLAPFYPKWDVNPANPLAWLPLAAGAGLLGGLWAARRRFGRGPLAAAAFFAAILAPALGFLDHGFMSYSWVADRFQYLASAGPLALAAAALARFVVPASAGHRDKQNKHRLKAGLPNFYLAAALLLALGALCFLRAGLYRDSVTLYSAAARAYPQCWGAHYVRGFSMLERGDDTEEALKSLDAAQRLHPYFMIANLMGQVQTALQRYPEAEASLKKTIELKPDYGEAHNSYGVLLNVLGRTDEAIGHFHTALELEPDNARAMAGLGVALKNQKKYAEAERYLAEAARREPANAEFQKELGVVLSSLGRGAEAAQRYREALRLDPANAAAAAGLKALADR